MYSTSEKSQSSQFTIDVGIDPVSGRKCQVRPWLRCRWRTAGSSGGACDGPHADQFRLASGELSDYLYFLWMNLIQGRITEWFKIQIRVHYVIRIVMIMGGRWEQILFVSLILYFETYSVHKVYHLVWHLRQNRSFGGLHPLFTILNIFMELFFIVAENLIVQIVRVRLSKYTSTFQKIEHKLRLFKTKWRFPRFESDVCRPHFQGSSVPSLPLTTVREQQYRAVEYLKSSKTGWHALYETF